MSKCVGLAVKTKETNMSCVNKSKRPLNCKIFAVFAFLNITKFKSGARMMMFHMNIEIIFCHSPCCHLHKISSSVREGFCYTRSRTFNVRYRQVAIGSTKVWIFFRCTSSLCNQITLKIPHTRSGSATYC